MTELMVLKRHKKKQKKELPSALQISEKISDLKVRLQA